MCGCGAEPIDVLALVTVRATLAYLVEDQDGQRDASLACAYRAYCDCEGRSSSLREWWSEPPVCSSWGIKHGAGVGSYYQNTSRFDARRRCLVHRRAFMHLEFQLSWLISILIVLNK